MNSRSERRHHEWRIKERMVRYLRAWNWWRVRDIPDDPRNVGIMANSHGTHDCFMCKAEKYLGKPKIRRGISSRIFGLDD